MRIFTFCLILFSTTAWGQDTGAMLAKAIQVSNSINANNSVEQRLSKYERIQAIVADIVSASPGSSESIRLLSGQSVGSFDYARIQSNYVSELADYFETVCVVAPNFECLGFVSLREGRKYCKADTYRQLNQAHDDLLNALLIFQSQDSKQEYFDLALNSFRACAGLSLLTNTETLTDRYASSLIPILLKLGKSDEARAIVQQVQNPFFKFQSALVFQIETKGLSEENITRFETYLKKNLATEHSLFWLASLTLHERGINSLGSSRIAYEPVVNTNFGSARVQCDRIWLRYYYDIAVELMDTTVTEYYKAPPYQVAKYRALNNSKLRQIFKDLARCDSSEAYDTTLLTFTYLKLMGDERAADFLAFAESTSFDRDRIQEYAFNIYKENPERFFNAADSAQLPLFDDFYGFKLALYEGDVCGAMKTMFEEFKGSNLYPKAVDYVLRSGDVDSSQKYDCGDAGLEMLLN